MGRRHFFAPYRLELSINHTQFAPVQDGKGTTIMTLAVTETFYEADHKLTKQDLDDIWYLVDYHGTKMWPDVHVQRLLTGIKNAKAQFSEQ
jgi:hypothetical protein